MLGRFQRQLILQRAVHLKLQTQHTKGFWVSLPPEVYAAAKHGYNSSNIRKPEPHNFSKRRPREALNRHLGMASTSNPSSDLQVAGRTVYGSNTYANKTASQLNAASAICS